MLLVESTIRGLWSCRPGTGNRDPARHTASALRTFLESYARGEMPSQPNYSCVLRMRGVPFQSELNDVLRFLRLRVDLTTFMILYIRL